PVPVPRSAFWIHSALLSPAHASPRRTPLPAWPGCRPHSVYRFCIRYKLPRWGRGRSAPSSASGTAPGRPPRPAPEVRPSLPHIGSVDHLICQTFLIRPFLESIYILFTISSVNHAVKPRQVLFHRNVRESVHAHQFRHLRRLIAPDLKHQDPVVLQMSRTFLCDPA